MEIFVNSLEPDTPPEGMTWIYIAAESKQLRAKTDDGRVFEYQAIEILDRPNARIESAGTAETIGDYIDRGEYYGKHYYTRTGNDPSIDAIAPTPTGWRIHLPNGDVAYHSNQDVEFPWLVTDWMLGWDAGATPLPIVVQI